jgi:hypothetical protein
VLLLLPPLLFVLELLDSELSEMSDELLDFELSELLESELSELSDELLDLELSELSELLSTLESDDEDDDGVQSGIRGTQSKQLS